MANWKETVFPKCAKLPTTYYQYLDDIWGTWEHGKESLLEFIQTLNDHHELIKVKATTNDTTINFLDTTIFKGPNFNRLQLTNWTQMSISRRPIHMPHSIIKVFTPNTPLKVLFVHNYSDFPEYALGKKTYRRLNVRFSDHSKGEVTPKQNSGEYIRNTR